MSAESFARALREKARLEKFAHDDHGRPAAFVWGVGFCAFSDSDLRRNLLRVADMIDGKGDDMTFFEGFKVIDRQTGDEADVKRIAKSEPWASSLVWTDMAIFAVDQDGEILLTDGCGYYAFPDDPDRFEVVPL